MMRRSFNKKTTRRRADRDQEAGAVLVEMVIVLPFLLLMVLGMLEMGLAWRDSATVNQASRQGARVASNLGDNADADLEALLSVMSILQGEDGTVEYVVIYDASGSGRVPVACESASVPGSCNHYTAAELANLVTSPPTNTNLFQCGGPSVDWCPSARSTQLASIDHIGVYVKVNRSWVTNIFPGDGIDLSGYTVMQLEPAAP